MLITYELYQGLVSQPHACKHFANKLYTKPYIEMFMASFLDMIWSHHVEESYLFKNEQN